MKYIVFNIEWNRPERRSNSESEPNSPHREMIQIGAEMLDENL